MKITTAQINVKAGDPVSNTNAILSVLKDEENIDSDLFAFSEMVIPGYFIGDNWERQSFLDECEKQLNRIIKWSSVNPEKVVVLGTIQFDLNKKNEDGRVRKHNCAIAIKKGKIVQTTVKSLQPNYREFDDDRHFYSFRKTLFNKYSVEGSFAAYKAHKDQFSAIEHKGYKIGLLLCEDGWEGDYEFSPMASLKDKVDFAINLSCSPFTRGKANARNNAFLNLVKNYGRPILYVNNCGIQNTGKNIYTFDGGSGIFNEKGFTQFLSPFQSGCSHFEAEEMFEASSKNDRHILPNDDIDSLYKSISYGIKEFLRQTGIDKVVIGASGGIDSAVVAALFSRYISPKNLYLINMPSKFNSDTTKSAAYQLAKNLGCQYHVIPIQEFADQTRDQLSRIADVSDFNFENIQARDRSARVLAGVASTLGAVFTCNANKTEFTIGYTTLYGDLGGFLAPLADVWKSDVYRLAEYINEWHSGVIPQESITVKASAELSAEQDVDKGKGDPLVYRYHDKLFYSWTERWARATPEEILSACINGELEAFLGMEDGINIVEDYFENNLELFVNDLERWWNLFDGFAFAKRIQSPPNITISRRAYGTDLRETQSPPFYSSRYRDLKEKLIAL